MSVEATAPLQNAAPNPPPVILIVPQPPILCRFYWMGCRELGSICCGGAAALNTANGPRCRGVGVTMVWGGGVWGVMRMGMMGSIGAGKYSWIPFCANHTSGPRDKYICEAQVDVYARIQAQSFAVHSQYIHRFICNALCVLCSVGSSVLKNALYLIQSDRLSLSIIYRAIHLAQWGSSVSTTVSNSELSDCSVSTTELSDRSCIWYWVAFGRKFQF